MTMTQYDAHGRFVRRAKFHPTVMAIWQRQVPWGRIEVSSCG